MGMYHNGVKCGMPYKNGVKQQMIHNGEKVFDESAMFDGLLLTTADVDQFGINIGAAGDFQIDWGDGTVDTINKTNTTSTRYYHDYAESNNYEIKVTGAATRYPTVSSESTISTFTFISPDKNMLISASGNITNLFPVIGDYATLSKIPRFTRAFYLCSNLTNADITHLGLDVDYPIPINYMFGGMFAVCTRLSSLPRRITSSVSKIVGTHIFANTFYNCSGLTGPIPSGLFGNLTGEPAASMFNGTFVRCSGLTGPIPSGLFGVISGAPAASMFNSIFYNCSGLTGPIPSGLFGVISGAPAVNMFYGTFYGCSGLTGPIPSGLFGNLTGEPAVNMFYNTFARCSGLTGIDDGIWDLSGIADSPVSKPFNFMFSLCRNITTESPAIAPGSSVKLWEHFTNSASERAFSGCTAMADYEDIPAGWK